MQVPSLKSISINTITKEAWTNSHTPAALIEVALVATGTSTTENNEPTTNYYRVNEAVIKNIMALNLPYKINVNIAMNYMKLEEEIAIAVLDFTRYLKFRRKEIILYFISKLVVKNSRVQYDATFLKILHDSFFAVYSDLSSYYLLSPKKMYKVYLSLMKSDDKKMYKTRLLKRYSKICHLSSCTVQYWIVESSKENNSDWPRQYNTNRNHILLEHVAKFATLDIVRYMYKALPKSQRHFIVSKALLSSLLSEQHNKDNILFLFSKLSRKKCFRIYMRYHQNIFNKLFLGYHGDFCLEVFFKLLQHGKFVTCREILYNSFKLLCSVQCQRYDCTSILYAHSKQIYLNMWFGAPHRVKSKLDKKFCKMLNMAMQKEDFHFVSILINDSVFSVEQRYEFTVRIVSKLLLESNSVKLDALERDCPAASIACMKENMTIDLIKEMLLTECESYNFDALSAFFESPCLVKQDLTNDKSFIVKAISIIAQSEDQMDNVQNFLKWLFDYNEEEVICFIQSHLVYGLWLVDICERYLLDMSRQLKCPKPSFLYCFDLSDEEVDQIRTHIRNNTDLTGKLCEYFMTPELCQRVSDLLEYLYNEGEEEEKQRFLLKFVSSEYGLTAIKKMFESKYYNEELYRKYEFLNTIQHYFCFITSWFEHRLASHSATAMTFLYLALEERWHPNDMREATIRARNTLLLPCEFTIDNVTIIQCNYRMFKCILQLDLTTNYMPTVKEDLADGKFTIAGYCRMMENRIGRFPWHPRPRIPLRLRHRVSEPE